MKKLRVTGKMKNSLPTLETHSSHQETDLLIEEDEWDSTDEWGFKTE